MSASLLDYLKSGSLYFLPHHAISRIVFKLTRIESPLVPISIKLFSKAFHVDLNEAKNTNPKNYRTFNEFFTRELKADSRPIADTEIICPVDGTISQIGDIIDGNILQAKGINYSLNQLLGDNTETTKLFKEGKFITIYLSPKDYHRIHMPCDGSLLEQTHIPGRLFSVAQHTVKTIKGIFSRNERVVTLFETSFGPIAMVLVGAINVAAIETVWDGLITPPKGKSISNKDYRKQDIKLTKGEEMGRFNMGSTVILIFPENTPPLSDKLKEDQIIKLGVALSC